MNAALRRLLVLARATHSTLREVVQMRGVKPRQALSRAVERWRFEVMVREVDAACRELRETNPQAWAEEMAERALWESTLMDGLRDEPWEGPPDA